MATTWKEGEAELKAALAPIASAKGTSATKIKVACSVCMKLVKDYKRVVHAVETGMWKSEVEHRLGFLYLIDAITRASQSKYGSEKDLFSPRFGIHLRHTISSVKQVPADNQHHVHRVIQDWIARGVFTSEDISKAGGSDYLKPLASQSSVPSTPTNKATPLNSEAEKEKLAQLLDNIKRIKQQREENDKSPPPPSATSYSTNSHNYAAPVPEQNNIPSPGQNTYQQSSYSYATSSYNRPPPATSSRPSRFDQQPPPANSRRDSPRKPRGRSRSRSRSPRRVRARSRSRSRSGARDTRSRRPEPILSHSHDHKSAGFRNPQMSPSSYQQAQSFNSSKYNAPQTSYNPPPSSYNPPPSSYNAASPTFGGFSSNGQTYQQGGFTKGTCRDFAQGRCFRGANCRFPHDQPDAPAPVPRVPTPPRTNPAQLKTKLCVNYPGSCRFGDRCSFAHGEGQLGQAIPPLEKEKASFVQTFDNQMYEEAPNVHVAPSPRSIPKRDERESSPPKQPKRQSRWGAKPPTVPETEDKPVDEEETAPAPEFTLEYDDDD